MTTDWFRYLAIPISLAMPPDDLTPEDYAAIVGELRGLIAADKFKLSRRIRRLREIVGKIDPQPVAEPMPLVSQKFPKPSSHVLKKRKRR